jgi:hypothetical protein
MPTIRLTHPVGDDQAGAVLEVDERRAQRLMRTGYAVEAAPVLVKTRRKEPEPCPSKDSR